MPKYKIVIHVDDSRIDLVKRKCQAAFGQDITAQVKKIETQKSRAERLGEAQDMVADAMSIVEELRGEMQDWKDNMPEGLQSGSKADEIDEAVSQLEEIESGLEQVDFQQVSFPGMM